MAYDNILLDTAQLDQARKLALQLQRQDEEFLARYNKIMSRLDNAFVGIDNATANGWEMGGFDDTVKKYRKRIKAQSTKAGTVADLASDAIFRCTAANSTIQKSYQDIAMELKSVADIAANFDTGEGQVLGASKTVTAAATVSTAFQFKSDMASASIGSWVKQFFDKIKSFFTGWFKPDSTPNTGANTNNGNTNSSNTTTTAPPPAEPAPTPKFDPRTTPPTADNPYYGDQATKANCTTYAENRAQELLGDTTVDFSGDAKTWWRYREDFNGYSTNANEPKIGALMVWGNENCPGPGHVAIVEDIIYNADGSVKTVVYSESAAGGLWYSDLKKQEYGQYNWYGNATNYWGCAGQTPSQIEKVTQTYNKQKITMGFVGYIYLQ